LVSIEELGRRQGVTSLASDHYASRRAGIA
jgi:hypothetical protein